MPKKNTEDDSTTDHGTWEHPEDGNHTRRTAATPAEAVQFAFDGWSRVDPIPAEDAPAS